MRVDGLAKRIREAMGDDSARSVARKAGISDSTLRSILAGARPTVDNLVALAQALGVGIEWLATGNASSVPDAGGVRAPVYADLDAFVGDAPAESALDLPQSMVRDRLGCRDEAIAAVTIRDDAMAPTLCDGDLALVDRGCDRVIREGLHVVTFEGTALLRRIQRSGAALIVEADNPAFRAWTVEARRVPEVRVIGRVVGTIRRI